MQVNVKIKRLQQLLLQSNVNSSKDCATYGNEAKLDYAKLDALNDENDDKSRKTFEIINRSRTTRSTQETPSSSGFSRQSNTSTP